MIQISHLTKYYGDFLAVNDLSFEIQVGHVYGFLGPNGAGKSTTMNIMTVRPSCRLFDFYAFLNSIEFFQDIPDCLESDTRLSSPGTHCDP